MEVTRHRRVAPGDSESQSWSSTGNEPDKIVPFGLPVAPSNPRSSRLTSSYKPIHYEPDLYMYVNRPEAYHQPRARSRASTRRSISASVV